MTAAVTHVTEIITPEMAEKYLKQNKLNRNIRQWHVKELAEDMTAHRFPENGENGITFDWNGNIAGGQHTLEAIKLSGVTLSLRVTRGIDPGSRPTMNGGLRQRFSDDLSVTGVRNATFMEPLVRTMITWDAVAKTSKGAGGLAAIRTSRISRATLAAEWPRYAAEATATMEAVRPWEGTWPGNRGVLHFTYWLLVHRTGSNITTVSDFLDRICYGSSESDDRTMFSSLRKKFSENPSKGFQTYFVVRAWNAWCKHENLTKLMMPINGIVDPYPRVHKAR
jgi:hypothetical protein